MILTVEMHGGIYSYSDNINKTVSWTLDEIPRYAEITGLSVKSRTINSITISYSVSRSANIFVRFTSGGDSTEWLNSGNPFKTNTTSGDIIIYYKNRASTNRLTPNSSYTIEILSRATISGLDRAKSISTTTYDIAKLVSVPNINIGASQTITWNNSSGASTSLKLCNTDGNTIIDYGTVTGTSKSITPTASTIYALTTNSNTYKARYIITTTVNSISYTNYKDFTFTVSNSNPTFSNFSYEDVNTKTTGLTGSNQILVSGYSNVKITISTANKATAKNSATMKNYRAIIGNQSKEANYSSTTNVTMQIDKATSGTIAVNAIDSRGNSTQALKIAEMKDYSKPIITKMQLVRSDNGVGENVTLNFEGTWWNKSFGAVQNAISKIEYWYKKTSSSGTFIKGTKAITFSINENKFSGSLTIEGDTEDKGFDASSSYYIYINVTDSLDVSSNHQETLGSGTPAVAIYKDNVAIGQKYDTSEGSKLQVNGDISGNLKGTADKVKINNRNTTDTWIPIVRSGNLDYTLRKKTNALSHTNHPTDEDCLPTLNFLSYWNGAYNGNGTSNLTYCYQGTIQAKPKVLYDNSSGTIGTVTLNETAANFSYLEVYYGDSNPQGSQRIYSPNGKKTNCIYSYFVNNLVQIQYLSLNISGTSITRNQSYYFNKDTQGVANDLRVFKVLGYK